MSDVETKLVSRPVPNPQIVAKAISMLSRHERRALLTRIRRAKERQKRKDDRKLKREQEKS